MNLTSGTVLEIDRYDWPWPDMLTEDRTAGNGKLLREHALVLGPEWLPPHQRMVVRLRTKSGELCLTPRELALNGASEQ